MNPLMRAATMAAPDSIISNSENSNEAENDWWNEYTEGDEVR